MWSLSLSQNTLLYKFNAFRLLTKHLLHTVAITYAVCGTAEKLAPISFSFFTISPRRLVLTRDLSNFNIPFFPFLIKSGTFVMDPPELVPEKGPSVQCPWSQ